MKKHILSLLAMALCSTAFSQSQGVETYNNYYYESITNPSLSYLRVSTSVGYESKYVFRGEELAEDSIQSRVDFAYPIGDFDVYLGAWANAPMSRGNNDEFTEVDVYIGTTYNYGKFTFDLGYIYYWFTDLQPIEDRTQEVYIGATMDTSDYLGFNINPSLYYYYNTTLDQHTIEVSMSYNAELGYYLTGSTNGLTMPIRVYSGWLTTADYAGTLTWDDIITGSFYDDINLSNDYWYVGASVDIAYDLSDYCKISMGARISYTQGDTRYDGEEKTFFWSGARVDFGF